MGIQPTMIWLVNVILWCFKYHGTSQETSTNGRFSFARSNCWRARDIPHTFLTLSSTFDIWPPLATHISTNIKQPGPDNLAWHSVNRLPGVVYRFLHPPCGIWSVMCGTRIDGSSYPTCPFNTFQLTDWNDVDNWITVGEPKSEILISVAYVLFGTVSFPLKASTFCRGDPLSSRSRVSWSSWAASVAMIRSFCWGKWVSDPWQGIPLSDPWYTWGKTIG